MKKLAGAFLVMGMVAAGQNPDDTKANKRDQKPDAATADRQTQDKQDVEITRKIRRELIADSSLSTYAKNVKIITRDGAVTLRGPVRSAEERSRVEQIARQAAGDAKVANEIEVSAK